MWFSFHRILNLRESHLTRILLYPDKLGISPPESHQVPSPESNDIAEVLERVEKRQSAGIDLQVQPQDVVQTSTKHGVPPDCEISGFEQRFECRRGCRCCCHVIRNIRTPRLMNALLGEMSIHWRSQKKLEARYNCSASRNVTIFYQFPQYSIQRYISIYLETTCLDGAELLSRVPRVLPWTHLLWRYSIYGDLKGVQRMFTDRVASPHDIDPAGRNALVHASKHKSTELAIFLLDQGADITQRDSLGNPASERFLKRSFGKMYNDIDTIIRGILKGNDSFNESGFTILHKIVLSFDVRELQVVLDATIDIFNTPDSLGRPCLFWAGFCNNLQHVRLLLLYGADPNIRRSARLQPPGLRSWSRCLLVASQLWHPNKY